MTDTFKEALIKSVLALVLFACCCIIGGFILSFLSLDLWADIAVVMGVLSTLGAAGCFFGLVIIQKFQKW